MLKKLYMHDCESCVHLGWYNKDYDLYYCIHSRTNGKISHMTFIVRESSEPSDNRTRDAFWIAQSIIGGDKHHSTLPFIEAFYRAMKNHPEVKDHLVEKLAKVAVMHSLDDATKEFGSHARDVRSDLGKQQLYRASDTIEYLQTIVLKSLSNE